MSILNKPENHYWRNMMTRALLVIITVTVIVWFLPRNEQQQLRYDIGKPWMYGSLIAKFDFPIYKSEEAVKKEKDSLMQEFQPYYYFSKEVEQEQIQKFYRDFSRGASDLSAQHIRMIAKELHLLYQKGIISQEEYNALNKDTVGTIRLINGKEAQSLPVSGFYSTLTAYEQLFRHEQLAAQRQTLQRYNLNNYIVPNIILDKERTDTERDDLLSGVPLASGMVLSGQKIIDRGEIVDDHDFRVLSSLDQEMKRRNASKTEITTTIFGQILYVTIIMILFTLYLALFRQDYFDKPRSITMLYSLITIFPVLVSLMIRHNFFSIYILPFAMLPMFVRVFMDSRTAYTAHVAVILISAAAVKYQYEFIIIQLIGGLVAVYSLRELSRRAQIFKSALLVTISTAVVYFTLMLMQNTDVLTFDQTMYIYFAVNGVLLLLGYPLMFLIEKAFGFISDVTLFELSSTNKGALRDLSEIAPGTFTHAITVGNLAAEIANKIGANSLLVRTGALYHDIGKMNNPVFFTENQSGVNPHENMDCKESARIIISHVAEGLKIAEQFGLPNIIKDFILTHHGTGTAKYFYTKYKNEHPDEDFDISEFRYPGPNPFTREQAILMMADTVEAASRSLPDYTAESISELVNRLIDGQVNEGFFLECPITFRDIAQIKTILTERLKSIYHTRISYPEEKKKEEPAAE